MTHYEDGILLVALVCLTIGFCELQSAPKTENSTIAAIWDTENSTIAINDTSLIIHRLMNGYCFEWSGAVWLPKHQGPCL